MNIVDKVFCVFERCAAMQNYTVFSFTHYICSRGIVSP